MHVGMITRSRSYVQTHPCQAGAGCPPAHVFLPTEPVDADAAVANNGERFSDVG